jgi:hypothetical protein
MSDRTSHRVRTFLREELPRWRAEGIVDAAAAERLTHRYGLSEAEGAGLAVAALYVLAACMVGAGVISLVAWHWDELARWVRLSILGAALVGAHVAGFWLWQVTGRQPRLGHALSLLGTIVFGASIGLVAQIFQVSGPWYGAFGAWALGALVAGLVLPSLPALCLAALLALFVWAPPWLDDHAAVGEAVAWLAAGGALALAYRFRSRVLLLLALAGLGTVLPAAVMAGTRFDPVHGAVLATILAVAAAGCALGLERSAGEPDPLAPAAAWLGRLGFYAVAYWLSYEWILKELTRPPQEWTRGWLTCALPPVLAAVTLLLARRPAPGRGLAWAAALVPAAFAVVFAIAVAGSWKPVAIAVLVNAALLAVAGLRIAEGLRERRRAPFWEGVAVAGAVALTRFFEIERLLWLKGAGFIACGVAVVLAALAFERRLQARAAEVTHG